MYKYPKIEKMTNEQLAYFAGLLDGEGCLRIGTFKNSNSDLRYRAFLQIAMTDRNAINWLSETISNGIYIDKKRKNPISKWCYCWVVNIREGEELLKRALPYLIVKKKQALRFIEFAQTLDWKRTRREPVPNVILNKRKKLYLEMKALNGKGRKKNEVLS